MPLRDYYRSRLDPRLVKVLIAAAVLLTAVLIFVLWQLISYGMHQRRELALRDELANLIVEDGPDQQPEGSYVNEGESGSAQAGTMAYDTNGTLKPALDATATITAPGQKPEILMTYYALWERNNDLVGWLNVQALPQVDLPVVQRDLTYYLRRDFDGNSNMNGTAFLDPACSIWPRSDNLIIYAHNMKSGEMFGGLHKLMHEPFYRGKPLASFNTLYERANYVPIAVVLCSIHQEKDFFNFHVTDFKSRAAFDAYIARARELSSVALPYDVEYGDQLLTLVTCYDEANEQRLLLILRRVRGNEDLRTLEAMWK